MKLFSVRSIFFAMLIAMSVLVSCQQTQEEVAPTSSTKKNKNAKSLSERLAENENFRSAITEYANFLVHIESNITVMSVSEKDNWLRGQSNITQNASTTTLAPLFFLSETAFVAKMTSITTPYNTALREIPELLELSGSDLQSTIVRSIKLTGIVDIVAPNGCSDDYKDCMHVWAISALNNNPGNATAQLIELAASWITCLGHYVRCFFF